jgi:hypothetical protein
VAFRGVILRFENPETNQRDVGFLIDSFNDHFHDRLKMLLLSNCKSAVFEEVDIHNILSPGFVILYEFS